MESNQADTHRKTKKKTRERAVFHKIIIPNITTDKKYNNLAQDLDDHQITTLGIEQNVKDECKKTL